MKKRVTKKVSKGTSREQREHLIWSSARHKEDRKKADELRAAEVVLVEVGEPPSREPFPSDVKFEAYFLLKKGETKLSRVKPQEFLDGLAEYGRVDAVYYRESGKVRKTDAKTLKKGEKELAKKGDPIMQKIKDVGYRTTYFSLPPWVTEELAQLVEAGGIAKAQAIVLAAIDASVRTFEELTGYRVVTLPIHPDSRNSFGWHKCYQPHWDGRLRGRSADGKEGRHGLRMAGDAMGCVGRYAQFVEVDARSRSMFEGKDDHLINLAVDKAIKKAAGPELWDSIQARGEAQAKRWKARRELAVAIKKAELENKNALGVAAMAEFRRTCVWPIRWESMTWGIWKSIPRLLRPIVAQVRDGADLDMGQSSKMEIETLFQEIAEKQIR